ncbi:zf-DHHC-domain-containing protein [Ramaria rubella]|nr:zf-DHHC-domain-containing protein [Ramaria rubella]
MTLLNLDIQSPAPSVPVREDPPRRGWLVYAPLAVAVLIIFMPHPSLLIMLVSHYLKTLHAPIRFWIHLCAVYGLTFLVLSSLMVCVVRDPGPVTPEKSKAKARVYQSAWRSNQHDDVGDSEQVTAALLPGARDDEGSEDGDGNDPSPTPIDVDELSRGGRWCRRCYQPRPERAHHCSSCGRCVLKMDHHCPWLGGNCVGHRTYPAFVHFIFLSTILATYIACVGVSVIVDLVRDPFSIDPRVSPLHALFLALIGAIFSLTMGSFLAYHLYLASTNQTTLEHMSPYLLLRYLPPPPDLQSVFPPQSQDRVPNYTSHPQQISQPKRYPPPPSSPHARPKVPPALADPPTPPDSPVNTSTNSTSHPLHRHDTPDPTPPYSNLDPHPPYTSAHTFRTTLPYRPPEDHELSSAQRRLVKHMHGRLRLYDLGFRRNLQQIFGGGRRGWKRWVWIFLCGGAPKGDGRTFEKRRDVDAGLERLARELEDIKKQEMRGV